ncbi:MAG: pentapeptide repeat-containing protein [Anaerolineae bacterium]
MMRRASAFQNEHRRLVLGLSAIIAVAIVVTLIVGSRRIAATQEARIADRYADAVEQLRSDDLKVRLRGIRELERIAKDSPAKSGPIMQTLTAFVRENAPCKKSQMTITTTPVPSSTATPQAPRPCMDIQAILAVIGSMPRRDEDYVSLDLQGADLQSANLIWSNFRGANLSDANLRGADLSGIDLSYTNLRNANLGRASLFDADLSGSDLSRANLGEADLREGNLSETDLTGTDLNRADLSDANLTGAYIRDQNDGRRLVTDEQLSAARSLAGATMPDGNTHE